MAPLTASVFRDRAIDTKGEGREFVNIISETVYAEWILNCQVVVTLKFGQRFMGDESAGGRTMRPPFNKF